jgi:quinol monooxygenase YgiN
MPISTKMNIVERPSFRILGILILAIACFTWPAQAQDMPKHDKIYVVIHVDSVPNDAASATKMLQQYAADTRKEKGAVRIELYVQISRTNHYSIVEVWQDQQAYDAHVAAAHTKQFRELIQPLLGSPFDERLHTILE